MMRSQALDEAHRRIAWIRIGGLVVCAVLAGRAAHLTVNHARAVELFEQQIHTEKRLTAARGAIVDREGRELALTVRSASVYAVPKEMKDRAETARVVAETLGVAYGPIAKRLAERERFTYLARWIDPEKALALRAKKLPGIGVEAEPRRSYPAGPLAASLIGFADIDGKGVRGVEQIENAWLTGKARTVAVERDARGRALAVDTANPRAVEGGEIALTLDAAMQGAAEIALAETVEKHGAKGGIVLTLDPRTGDILALAEAPGFDPNEFRKLDYESTRARSFSDVVEAGSTMKVFLAASALDAGAIDETTWLDTGDGSIRVPGKTIKDRDPFGVITPTDMLRVSSNVGAVQVAQRMGAEAQHRGLERFGFGKPTGSGFPMESAGLLRGWRRWRPVDQATVAFGQGVSVTPIQLGVALASLANDGMRMQPRIVLARRARSHDPWQPTEIREAGRALSPAAAHATLDMMQAVVSPTGTGRLAGLAGVAVAGKTGTAQKLDVALKKYSQSRYIAWFVGIVPADDPELAIVVAVDEPAGYLHTGGMVAAPLFARVAAAQLARRNIITEPQPIAPPPPPTLVAANAQEQTTATPDVAAGPDAHRPSEPGSSLEAVSAAPPARPVAAPAAAGPHRSAAALADSGPDASGPEVVARAEAGDEPASIFVPDFLGETLGGARRIAQSESLELTTRGAVEGRVVSQHPVAGTVMGGADRTVRLLFAPAREEG